MHMPIGEVLEKAFKYPWKNKALWFYGILIAIFSAGSNMSNEYSPDKGQSFFETLSDTNVLLIALGITIFVITFAVLGAVISSWSQAAIANGTDLLEKGKSVDRKKIGKTGKRVVWNLIVLNVLIPLLAVLALMTVIGLFALLLSLIAGQTGVWIGVALLVLLIIALIPFAIYLGLVWILASRYVILEKKRPVESIKTAFKLIKGKFWWTFLFALVQGLISGMAGFIAMIPLFIFIAGAFGFFLAKIYIAAIIMGIFAFFLLFPILLISGYFISFSQTGWTLWWLKLKEIKKEK